MTARRAEQARAALVVKKKQPPLGGREARARARELTCPSAMRFSRRSRVRCFANSVRVMNSRGGASWYAPDGECEDVIEFPRTSTWSLMNCMRLPYITCRDPFGSGRRVNSADPSLLAPKSIAGNREKRHQRTGEKVRK